jgi:hypothetical protein
MPSNQTSPPPLSWSRSFIKQESIRTSRLLRAIESLRLPGCSLRGSVTLRQGKNGVAAVVVPPSSEHTAIVIMPYGMLLLSLHTAQDVTTVESVMNFIKEFMEEQGDIMNESQPVQEAEARRLNELEDTEKLMYALREIAETSEDPESVRVAFIALTTTRSGIEYLRGNPIRL